MKAIYKKEMRAFFTQMTGYVFLGFLLLLMGIWFTFLNLLNLSANIQHVLSNVTIFFFILMPTLTMRIFSEEAKQKTDQLLFTSPLTVAQIVIGKFLASLSLFFVGIVITILLPLMVMGHTELPVSQIVGAYIGFFLLGAACISVGIFVSVLTENQIIAAVGTMGAIFVMFLMDMIAISLPTSTFASLMFVVFIIATTTAIWYNSTKNVLITIIFGMVATLFAGGLYLVNNLVFDGIIVRVLLWFSVFARFSAFTNGLLHLSDVVYYISFCFLFVYLTINIIEKRRWV